MTFLRIFVILQIAANWINSECIDRESPVIPKTSSWFKNPVGDSCWFFCVYYRRLQFEFEKWEVSKIWTFDNYASVLWLCYILIFGKQFIVGQNRVRSFHFGGQWKWLNLTLFREINLIFIHYFEPRSYAQYGKTKNLVLDYVVPSKDFSSNQLHFT